MRRYVLDTNHAGRLLNPASALRKRMAATPREEFTLCQPAVGELWFMVLNSTRVAANRRVLERMLSEIAVREYDAAAAYEFGAIRVELRRKGRPLPQIDVQIAAIARVNDLTLLTADGHFAHVDGLRMENWLA